MYSRSTIEQKLKELKPILEKEYFVQKIGYFGSYAKNSQGEHSDLDILVEFSQPVGWEFFSLEQFLEKHFNIKVDLVTKNALKKRIKDRILNQVIFV